MRRVCFPFGACHRVRDRLDEMSKVEEAIKALLLAAEMSKEYYGAPLIIAYSGGKDSDVLLDLARKALKPEELEVYSVHTTLDAPETVYHIRDVFKELTANGIKTEIIKPTYKGKPITMWGLIVEKCTPPTRLFRYCCKVLKEHSTPNRMVALGVRMAESKARQGRDVFATRGKSKKDATFYSLDHAAEVYREAKEINDPVYDCNLITRMKKRGEIMVNPIYTWTDNEVWDYIRTEGVKINPLYEKGYNRVGCIGCPYGRKTVRGKQFADYPKYKENYIRAFDKMLKRRKERGLKDIPGWTDGAHVFKWWVEDTTIEGQITIDEWLEGKAV